MYSGRYGVPMEMYKMLMEINRKQVFGEEISDAEKKDAVAAFLNGVCDKEEILKYKKRMRVNAETDNIYPYFYIPPYNANKKLRIVQGYLPKTNILYANHYELEIIRLLYMFAPENEIVCDMVKTTLQRLKGDLFRKFLYTRGMFSNRNQCTAISCCNMSG